MKTIKIKKSATRNLVRLNELNRGYDMDSRYVGDTLGNVYRVKDEEGDDFIVAKNKPFITKDGYVEYVLTNSKGKKKHIMGEIVTAGLWLVKPEGKDYVNHKDGKRSNNKVTNLEWTTQSENIKHSYNVLKRKPVNQYTKVKKD